MRIEYIGVIVVLILGTLGMDSLCAQTYGRIDTIRTMESNKRICNLVAFDDTLSLVTSRNSDYPCGEVSVSFNGGENWAEMFDYPMARKSVPGIGTTLLGCRGANLNDDPDYLNYYWIARHGSLVKMDTSGLGPKNNKGCSETTTHPFDPHVIFRKQLINGQIADINPVYSSVDDGNSWQLIDLPAPERGLGFVIDLFFNYSDSIAWYFKVSGYDHISPDFSDHYYRTIDSGKTFQIAQTMVDNFFGLLGDNTTLTFDEYISYAHEPLLKNLATGEVDSLFWLRNIRQSLYPSAGEDTVIRKAYTVRSDWDRSRFAFNPLTPEFFSVAINEVSYSGADSVNKIGFVVTTDTGKSWQWVMKPFRYRTFYETYIDPISKAVYVATDANEFSDVDQPKYLLKCTPWLMSVKEENNQDSFQIRCVPNPASSVVSIYDRLQDSYLTRNVVAVDILGHQIQLNIINVERIDDVHCSTTVDISTLSSGYYQLNLSNKRKSLTVPLVVAH